MVDGVASLTAMLHGMLAAGLWTDRRGDNLLDGAAPSTAPTAPPTAASWPSAPWSRSSTGELLDALGLDRGEWPQHDRSRWPEQSGRLAAIFASRTRADWELVFAGRDACVTPVLSLAEAATSAELRERGTFVDWDGVPQPAPAPRLSASAAVERPRSRWCGDTDQVLAELGYPADEIAGLRAARGGRLGRSHQPFGMIAFIVIIATWAGSVRDAGTDERRCDDRRDPPRQGRGDHRRRPRLRQGLRDRAGRPWRPRGAGRHRRRRRQRGRGRDRRRGRQRVRGRLRRGRRGRRRRGVRRGRGAARRHRHPRQQRRAALGRLQQALGGDRHRRPAAAVRRERHRGLHLLAGRPARDERAARRRRRQHLVLGRLRQPGRLRGLQARRPRRHRPAGARVRGRRHPGERDRSRPDLHRHHPGGAASDEVARVMGQQILPREGEERDIVDALLLPGLSRGVVRHRGDAARHRRLRALGLSQPSQTYSEEGTRSCAMP